MIFDLSNRKFLIAATSFVILILIVLNINLLTPRSEVIEKNQKSDAQNFNSDSEIQLSTEVEAQNQEQPAEYIIKIRYNKNGHYELLPTLLEVKLGDQIIIKNTTDRLQYLSSEETVSTPEGPKTKFNIGNALLSPGDEITFIVQS